MPVYMRFSRWVDAVEKKCKTEMALSDNAAAFVAYYQRDHSALDKAYVLPILPPSKVLFASVSLSGGEG